MAVKISQLPAATTPLDGTEDIAIVQDNETRQVNSADLASLASANLSTSTTTGAVTIANSAGTDAIIPAATTLNAGALTATDKDTIDALGALSPLDTVNATALVDDGIITEPKLSAAVRTKLNNTAPNKFDATAAPTANSDSADTDGNGTFAVGSTWIDTVGNEAYRCLDATPTAAVWIKTTLTTDELGTLATLNTINATNLIDDGIVTEAKLSTDAQAKLDLAVSNASTGVVDGMVASGTLGGTTFDLTAGTAQIIDSTTDPLNPTRTEVSYAGATGIAITDIATSPVTYVGINSSGTILQNAGTGFTAAQRRDIATVAILVHAGGTLQQIQEGRVPLVSQTDNDMLDLSLAIGPINLSGDVFSANGANLNIDKSAGSAYFYGLNRGDDAKDPSTRNLNALTATSFIYTWRDGSGGWVTANATEINPGRYDDGTGGATEPDGTIANNNWSIQRIYLTGGNVVAIHYGQEEYNNQASALEAIETEAFEVNPSLEGTILRCFLLVRGNATNLSQTNRATFVEASKFGGVGSGPVGTGASDLQAAYDLSTIPQITTDAAKGTMTVQDGTGDDTNVTFQVRNNAGTATFTVDGDGSTITPSDVLVGRTTTSEVDKGVVLFSSGGGLFVVDANRPMTVNRLTDDGELVSFRQDSTAEGSIGTSGSQMYVNGTSELAFRTGDTARAVIDNSGQFGINTTSPQETLDVNGSVMLGYNNTAQGSVYKEFDPIHQAANQSSAVAFGLADGGGIAGVYVENVASTVSGFNSQEISLRTSQGAVVGSTERVRIAQTGNIRFNAYGAGTLTTDSSGNITASSDIAKKNVLGSFSYGLQAILGLDPVEYTWKEETGYDTENVYAGFTAQNVKEHIPAAVFGEEGDMTLADRPIIAALVNAVKTLSKQNDELVRRIDELEAKA